MSYDLMVFDVDSTPQGRSEFMEWYDDQTKWEEEHSYDDPNVTTEKLRAWFLDIIQKYPALNGPYASDDVDDPKITDYSIGTILVYAAFSWPEAEDAYDVVFSLAEKHGVGFFNVSSDAAEVWIPDGNGALSRIHAN